MKTINIAGKKICIVQSHNQVLEAWEEYQGLNVFSLDYHTDTRRALYNYSYWRADSELKAGQICSREERINELIEEKVSLFLNKKMNVKQINDNLKHDEHLDFAVSTNMVNRVFVLCSSRNESSSNPNVYIMNSSDIYNNQRIVEYPPSCIPECRDEIHNSDCYKLRADSVIEDSFLQDAVYKAEVLVSDFFENYILDIDCDFFNTDQSLYPGRISVFKTLIKKSRLVTIAREPECVKICRHKGCLLTSDKILERLLSIIGECSSS